MPSPGRSSCEIRVSPDPVRSTRALPIHDRSVAVDATLETDRDHTDPAAADIRPPTPARARSPTADHRAWRVATAGWHSRSAVAYVCPACFGPLEVTYDLAVVAADADPRRDRRASPRASGATSSCCRSRRRRRGRCRSGRRRCSPPTDSARPSASTGCWIKDDTRNPSLSFKDRAGRHRRRARRRIRRPGPRLRLDRQPRRGDGGGCGGRRAPGLRVHPGRPRARPRSTTRSPTARRSSRSTAPTTTSTGCASRSPTRPAGASSTSTCARSTRRGRRPSPTRSPSRSAGGRPTSSSRPVASGAMFTRVARGFEELAELGLIERRPIRFVGGQAAGCAPVATAFERGHRRHRAGPRARHDRPLAGHRQPGRRALRGRGRARRAAARSRRSRTTVTAAAIRDVARLEGIYPETAGGVTLGAVAAARRRGVIRDGDEVVALLTGNGLKTPDARTLGLG